MADGADFSEEQASPERRAAQRFPLMLQLRYKVFRHADLLREGTGRTMNISSGGILFHADTLLEAGLRLELSIAWPMGDETSPHLRLLGAGEVVWAREAETAVHIRRHEFRAEARKS